MREGKVQIYTGNGKGKTTAAFGAAFRAMGYGHSVIVIQFQKRVRCGEHMEAEKIGLEVIHCPRGRGSSPCAAPCPLLEAASKIMKENPPQLMILDEIMAAIHYKCVSEEEVLALLLERAENTEVILTGRNAPKALTDAADLVTAMEPVKHYFRNGVPAREGIEY